MVSPPVGRWNHRATPDTLARFTKEVLFQAEQLEGRDLAVTKISINMGKTSTDSLGRSNPVEKMLFYRKGNLQATKSEI